MPRVTSLPSLAINDLPVPPGVTPSATLPVTVTVASPAVTPVPTAQGTATSTPPATLTSENPDTMTILLVVVVVLGSVVLIAWLLKPLIARRLAVEETATDKEPSAEWSDAWEQPRPDAQTRPSATEIVPDSATPAGEIVLSDIVEVEPATTAEPAAVIEETAEAERIHAGEIAGITLTVRELLDNANAGQLLRGFALYSDGYLERFRAELGLSAEEFAVSFGAVPAALPENQAELAAVTDVDLLPDGRVSALISFGNGGEPPPPERFTFVRAGDRWLIDDILTNG